MVEHWVVHFHPVIKHHLLVIEVKRLLEKRWDSSGLIRLIGVGVSSLERAKDPEQPELFEDQYDKQKKVEQTVLGIKTKLSTDSIIKASLLGKEKNHGRL